MLFDFPLDLLLLKAGTGRLVEYTATGNPLTFNTNVAKPLRSLLIPFTPTQTGTGDPSPENVRQIFGIVGLTAWRTGKNLFNAMAVTLGKWINGSGAENTDIHGAITGLIPVIAGETYVLSTNGAQFPTTLEVCEYNASKTFIKRTTQERSGTGAHANVVITATPNTLYIKCGVYAIEESAITTEKVALYEMQFELAETATEYSPYTGESFPVVFPAQGKNLLALPDADFTLKGVRYKVVDGGITLDGTSSGETSASSADFKTYLSFNLKAGTYYFNRHTYPNPCYLRSDITGTDANLVTNKGSFTLEHDAKVWVGFYVYQKTFDNLSVPLSLYAGNTEQPYEPFDNTVYGGTLDLVTGVLTVTHKILDTVWSAGETNGELENVIRKVFVFDGVLTGSNAKTRLCNIAKYSINYTSDTVHYYIGTTDGRVVAYVFLPVDTPDDTPIQVCEELATPQTIQLDPVTVNALVGDNTIWSDTNGENTAVYLKKA